MNVISLATPHFSFDGRGPTLRRFLRDHDLLLPGSDAGYGPSAGLLRGAEYDTEAPGRPGTHHVIFHGIQVFQVAGHEVHSHWHREYVSEGPLCGAFLVEQSHWLESFHPRHLGAHRHFVLEWYDHIVEVVCRELIFGEGEFDIMTEAQRSPKLGYAYFRHAVSQTTLGNTAAAIESWERYLACAPYVDSLDYARRCLDALRARS